MNNIKKTLTYDDVLLVPQYSDIESRKEVDIGNWLDQERNMRFNLPIISSPMDTITEEKMAIALGRMGGLGIVHRYNTIERQVEMAENILENIPSNKVGFAIGITGDYLDRATQLIDVGIRILCLDVAHGDHVLMERALKTLRNKFGKTPHLMAGNVATLQGANRVASWGANSIRVGIGGGSICSTRIQTGHGVPSLESVLDCSLVEHDVAIIADGGIKNSGDISKALAAKADFAMIGSILAGTDCTPVILYWVMMVLVARFIVVWHPKMHKWIGEEKHLLLKVFQLLFHIKVQLLILLNSLKTAFVLRFHTVDPEQYKSFGQKHSLFVKHLLL